MSSQIVTSSSSSSNNNSKLAEDEDQVRVQEQLESTSTETAVTRHLYLKPAHSSQAFDKEAVLHRIRQRKRANKLRTALQDLIRSPTKPNNIDNDSDEVSLPHKIRWVDDAFAAL
ncbi:hypothetical protein TIFTF001_005265 [Ficus carica]|uniref:Uncharacterized protein n=1 Tax=Ficus carica TaxID=3494 RepID=A0AA87ZXQ4_FICCA|nr:hypothetical protein TIFTF001_005265 [Ficus carica]